MARKYFISIIFILCLVSSGAKAQTTSSGEWLGVKLDFNLPKKFTFNVLGETRILNNQINVYKNLIQFKLEYKLNKHFDIAASYRFAWRKEENSYFYSRNKIFADLNFDYPVKRFKFKDRLRYQRMTKDYINSEWDKIPSHHIRNKFEVSYNIKNNKITPGLFAELFFPIQDFRQRVLDEYRIGAELKYPTTKKQSLTVGLMYARELYLNTFSVLLIRFRYNFKFKI